LTRDAPHEAGKLAREGCDRLLMILSAAQELLVPAVQAMLSLPSFHAIACTAGATPSLRLRISRLIDGRYR